MTEKARNCTIFLKRDDDRTLTFSGDQMNLEQAAQGRSSSSSQKADGIGSNS